MKKITFVLVGGLAFLYLCLLLNYFKNVKPVKEHLPASFSFISKITSKR